MLEIVIFTRWSRESWQVWLLSAQRGCGIISKRVKMCVYSTKLTYVNQSQRCNQQIRGISQLAVFGEHCHNTSIADQSNNGCQRDKQNNIIKYYSLGLEGFQIIVLFNHLI